MDTDIIAGKVMFVYIQGMKCTKYFVLQEGTPGHYLVASMEEGVAQRYLVASGNIELLDGDDQTHRSNWFHYHAD